MLNQQLMICTGVVADAFVVTPLAGAQTEAASTTAADPLAQVDKDFVQAASMSSSTEIDAAKLATTTSEDSDVKSFSHHVMLDHTKLAVQLKMASPHGVTLPKDNSHTVVLDSLKDLKGKAFDQTYIAKVGVAGHKQAVIAFQKEIADGQDAKLKKGRARRATYDRKALADGSGPRRKKGVSQQHSQRAARHFGDAMPDRSVARRSQIELGS